MNTRSSSEDICGMDSAKPAKELESCFLKFFQIRNTPGEKNIICSSSRITHLLKLLHRLVSRGTAAALEPKKVIALKVKVQKEIKYIRLLELELGWFWFMSGKPPWEGAMPSKPSGWSKKTSFLQRVQWLQILSHASSGSKPLCSAAQHSHQAHERGQMKAILGGISWKVTPLG